jgi:uncharacterized protein (DUF885 family)
MYGIPGYDDLMPDESEEGAQAWRAEVAQFLGEADAIAAEPLSPADAVTLDCTREAAVQELASIDLARAEYTVTAMQYAGPAVLMAVAARTVLLDAAAAEAYLARLRRSGVWLDQLSERLRAGAQKGRLPVAPLMEQAITWAEAVLAGPAPAPLLSPQPPQGWIGTAAWEAERRLIAAEVVKPALVRWVATVNELLPRARPSEQAGLVHLPGGEEDYARAVRIYTTLPLHPGQLHQTGLDHIAALEARAVELGAGLGLSGLAEVFDALRDSAGKISPAEAIREAAVAVRRAEARAAEFFPQPLPPPCEVTPMPERRRAALHSAAAGRRPGRDVLVQHRAAHRRDRMGHRGGGLPRSGPRASPAALPPATAHRAARAPAPAQPARVLRGLGPVRRATRRGSRALRRRSRPARLDQHVADAGRPAGGGHRHPLLRVEPGAGP